MPYPTFPKAGSKPYVGESGNSNVYFMDRIGFHNGRLRLGKTTISELRVKSVNDGTTAGLIVDGKSTLTGATTISGAATLSSTLALTGAITLADGGAVTQATSKSTGVTLSKRSGKITMNAAALAAATEVSFTVTNTTATAADVAIVNHVSGGTAGSYLVQANTMAAGSFKITVSNVSTGGLSEAIVLQFALITATVA